MQLGRAPADTSNVGPESPNQVVAYETNKMDTFVTEMNVTEFNEDEKKAKEQNFTQIQTQLNFSSQGPQQNNQPNPDSYSPISISPPPPHNTSFHRQSYTQQMDRQISHGDVLCDIGGSGPKINRTQSTRNHHFHIQP